MTQRVFFLNTLREGIDPAAYEEWVRTVDYPVARRQAAIDSYVVTRLDGHVTGEGPLPCQYLEVIEVTSVEDYRTSLGGNAELEALLQEWSQFVGDSVIVYGEVIEG
jgi:hypothetical protein